MARKAAHRLPRWTPHPQYDHESVTLHRGRHGDRPGSPAPASALEPHPRPPPAAVVGV